MKRPRVTTGHKREERALTRRGSVEIPTAEKEISSPKYISVHHRRSTQLPRIFLAGLFLLGSLVMVPRLVPSSILPVVDAAEIVGGYYGTSTAGKSNLYDPSEIMTHLGTPGFATFVKDNLETKERDLLVEAMNKKRRILNQKDDENVVATSSESGLEECVIPASECMDCTYTEQKTYDACHPTGKWQKFECLVVTRRTEARAEQEFKTTEGLFQMKSCKRTPFDEGLVMMELQMFCLLIGAISLISVRKQKRLSASMFDRRKQGGNVTTGASRGTIGNNKRSSNTVSVDDEEIEFTPMTNQRKEEKLPLMAIQPHHMEVV